MPSLRSVRARPGSSRTRVLFLFHRHHYTPPPLIFPTRFTTVAAAPLFLPTFFPAGVALSGGPFLIKGPILLASAPLSSLFVCHTNKAGRARWRQSQPRLRFRLRPAIPGMPPARRARPTARRARCCSMRLAPCSGSAASPGTSISDIATAANAFPSQITYYFRTKEALFVECACRDLLYLARATEQAALKARTPREYTHALAETVTATDSDRLLRGGADPRRAAARISRRWSSAPSSACTPKARAPMRARSNGTAGAPCARPTRARGGSGRVAIGVIVEGYAMGRSPEELCSEMLRVLGDQAEIGADDNAPPAPCRRPRSHSFGPGELGHDRTSHACPRIPDRRAARRSCASA